jgi:uncharacterized protein (DUF433 family)
VIEAERSSNFKANSLFFVGGWNFEVGPIIIGEHMNEGIERITINPEQCGGRPCIRGMRIRVSDILELYAAGLSEDKILGELPDLEKEDLRAALRYASRRLDHPVLAA